MKFIKMKKIILSMLLFSTFLFLFSCGNKNMTGDAYVETTAEDIMNFDENYDDKDMVVVYFSCTGNTKAVAEKIGNIFDIKTIPIEPVEPYLAEDLLNDENSRARREHYFDVFNELETDELEEGAITELPKIKNINLNRYDYVFLGYPIWWGEAPKVLYTFISEMNLSNKTIIPFCTSDNGDIGASDQNLANYAPEDVYFMSGKRFSKDSSEEEIKDWLTTISVDLDIQ